MLVNVLHELLRVAIAGPRVDRDLSSTVLCGRSFNGATTAPRASLGVLDPAHG